MEAPSQPAGPKLLTNKLHPLAVHQFVTAGGPVTVLKALKKHKLCEEQMLDSIRAISAVMHMWQVCKPLVKKGLAAEIIQLLEPCVHSSHPKVVTNTAYCMMQLISTEQLLLQREQEEQQAAVRQQGDKQQQQQDKQQQQQQELLPPVLSAVLAHADLKCFLAPVGPDAEGSCPGNFYQACMEFFPVLLETRAAYKAFKTQQPALFRQMLDNAVCGIALVAPQALAAVLQTLYTVYRHGGLDVFYKELRPILLKYPADWEGPQAEFVTTASSPDGHRDVVTLKPGEPMVCHGLFISCLLDAAESDTETNMLDLGPVKMWRTSALLLRAVWDSVPELRPMYVDFMDRFETLESRRPRGSKDKDVFTSIMLRMSAWQFCPAQGKTFPDQKSWMALVKKDPAAKTQPMQMVHNFFAQ